MYLSKLVLDPKSRQVQAELANRYELHRTLANAFLNDSYKQNRLLYRLETSHDQPYLTLLLQSASAPDWSGLEQKAYLLEPAQVKRFEPQFQKGEKYLFRLTANPTKRLRRGDQSGKRVPLYMEEDQQQWILRKAEKHGFQLMSVQITNLNNELSHKIIDKKRVRLTHHGVRFEGILMVNDEESFGYALMNGIGSAKGFGFGLLSLACY